MYLCVCVCRFRVLIGRDNRRTLHIITHLYNHTSALARIDANEYDDEYCLVKQHGPLRVFSDSSEFESDEFES